MLHTSIQGTSNCIQNYNNFCIQLVVSGIKYNTTFINEILYLVIKA